MKKLIFSLLTFLPVLSFGAAQQPINGGTGVANSNSNTIAVNAPMVFDGSTSSAFSIDNSTKGSRPYPKKTQAERDAIVSPESGLIIYNTTTQTLDYFDGLDWDNLLSIQKLLAGSNVTITDNGDGTVTINAAGSGGATTQARGAFTVNQNMTATIPSTSTFMAFAIDPAKFSAVSQDNTTVTTATVDSVTTPIITNTASGGAREFKITYDIGINPTFSDGQLYTFAIAVKPVSGPVSYTNFQTVFAAPVINTTGSFKPISISGLVSLNTNDYVYLAIKSNLASEPLVAYTFNSEMIDTTVANLPDTDALAQGANNWYLSQNGGTTLQSATGSITDQHLAKFSGTSGLVSDSGVGLSDLNFQYFYNHDIGYPESDITLANDPAAGFCVLKFGGSTASMCAQPNGISTNLGLNFSDSGSFFDLGILNTGYTNTGALYNTVRYGAAWYPAMTTAQRDAITFTNTSSTPQGVGIFNVNTQTLNFWDYSAAAFVSDIMLSGASVANNIPQFSNTSGRQIDSGIPAANLILSSGSYANPAWVTSLVSSKITGLTASNAVITNGSGILTTLGYGSANVGSTLVERDAGGNVIVGGVTASTVAANAIALNSTSQSIALPNNGQIVAKNASGLYENFMFPRFSDNKTYMDIGSAGANFRQNGGAVNWMTVDASSNVSFPTGNILVTTAGKTASIKSGVNGCIGTQALSGSSTTVNTSCATTGDLIFFTITAPGGTPGHYSFTISNGVSFTVTSTSGSSDTSTIGWWGIKKP